MGILDELRDPGVWRAFYEHKTEKAHLSRKDAHFFEEFIRNEDYRETVERLFEPDYCFSPPEKRLINKLGTDKKRVVYSFSPAENAVLKLTAFLLYRYDRLLPENCYSFRRELGAKNAIRRMVNLREVDGMYCCKLDIKNYFNSIDIDILLPELKVILTDDPMFFDFLSRLLSDDRAVLDGQLVCEKRGAMAGTPISPFLANVYLMKLDADFERRGIPYARYSDDIIFFAPDETTLARLRDGIFDALAARNLAVNPDKLVVAAPGERWEYLGIEYRGGNIDLSLTTKRKIFGKIRRKARALYRWKLRKSASDEKAMSVFFRVFNRKFFENPDNNEFTWARWFFPLVTVSDGFAEIDAYMQDNARYLCSGKHNKANYRVDYSQLKQCGYKSLVNAFYKYKKELRKTD